MKLIKLTVDIRIRSLEFNRRNPTLSKSKAKTRQDLSDATNVSLFDRGVCPTSTTAIANFTNSHLLV